MPPPGSLRYSHPASPASQQLPMPTRLATLALCLGALAGCNKPAPTPAAAKPPEVLIDRPLVDSVTDSEEFPGRLEPVDSIVVRSRVTGYLDKVHFVDGADVTVGDPLF